MAKFINVTTIHGDIFKLNTDKIVYLWENPYQEYIFGKYYTEYKCFIQIEGFKEPTQLSKGEYERIDKLLDQE